MADMLTLEAFEEASAKVKEVTQETKLVESPSLSAQCGNRVWLKPENMQRTGAYKLRGAYYKISKLSQEELDRGVITASAGNHAQGVAYAASHAGARSVVVMPTTTPATPTLLQFIPEKLPLDQLCRLIMSESAAKVTTKSVMAVQI